MNFQSTTQPYIRSVIQVGVGQYSSRQRKGNFPTSVNFWRPVGKIAVLLLPVVLAVNIYVTSSINKTNDLVITADNKRHELMDKNIELRAMKARLRVAEQFQQLAADKLSLYVHTKGQVGTFSRRKGYFTYF